MSDMKWIDKGILSIIKKFEYDMFVVNVNQDILCVCRDFTTKQGDPNCKLCLGTGKKIKIRKARAASMDSSASFKNYGMDEKSLATIFYMDPKYIINDGDLIVDGDTPMIANRVEKKRGTNKERIYNQCFCITMKTSPTVFIKNFKEIINGK